MLSISRWWHFPKPTQFTIATAASRTHSCRAGVDQEKVNVEHGRAQDVVVGRHILHTALAQLRTLLRVSPACTGNEWGARRVNMMSRGRQEGGVQVLRGCSPRM